MKNFIIAVIAVLISSTPHFASAAAVVESLQTPVWIERGSDRIALMPGMEIIASDRVRTGGEGKLKLRLEEGSDVKLGENVELAVESLAAAEVADDSVFSAAFEVLKGAFRFTTTLLGKNRQRNVQFNVGTATVGIRGTDVWGKAAPDRDFVVLLEGKIELNRDNTDPLIMDQPLTIYDAPRASAALPVAAVDLEQLKLWAAETELDPGRGVISADGRFRVYLGSYRRQSSAQDAAQALQYRGYPVELFSAEINDDAWIRLGIKGFDSYADAEYFSKQARQHLAIPDAWISRS